MVTSSSAARPLLRPVSHPSRGAVSRCSTEISSGQIHPEVPDSCARAAQAQPRMPAIDTTAEMTHDDTSAVWRIRSPHDEEEVSVVRRAARAELQNSLVQRLAGGVFHWSYTRRPFASWEIRIDVCEYGGSSVWRCARPRGVFGSWIAPTRVLRRRLPRGHRPSRELLPARGGRRRRPELLQRVL